MFGKNLNDSNSLMFPKFNSVGDTIDAFKSKDDSIIPEGITAQIREEIEEESEWLNTVESSDNESNHAMFIDIQDDTDEELDR